MQYLFALRPAATTVTTAYRLALAALELSQSSPAASIQYAAQLAAILIRAPTGRDNGELSRFDHFRLLCTHRADQL